MILNKLAFFSLITFSAWKANDDLNKSESNRSTRREEALVDILVIKIWNNQVGLIYQLLDALICYSYYVVQIRQENKKSNSKIFT